MVEAAVPSIVPHPEQGRTRNTKGSKNTKKPVRRDPERRRQQNILAQKRYREKLKQRIEHLETLAACVSESQGHRVTATDQFVVSSDSTTATDSTTTHEGDSPDTFIARNLEDQSIQSTVGFSDFGLSTSTSLSCSADVNLWNASTYIDPSHLIYNSGPASQPQSCPEYIDCGCVKPHVQVNPQSMLVVQYENVQVQNTNSQPFLSHPYVNGIRIERTCIVQAVRTNFTHIGISEAMCCDDEAVSPLFRPSGNASSESAVVSRTQTIFKSLKQDLRPIREQITIMHHPVIDVLPFPTLRKNLLKSADAVDDEDLFHDLINGLICWGGSGANKSAAAAPWDCRSWEARPWFLAKYWVFLGGEDGELVRQSKWWQSMRGEETTNS